MPQHIFFQECLFFLILISIIVPQQTHAHFGMLIPDDTLLDQEKRQTTLTLSFSHPFSGVGMDLGKPARFFVDLNGQQIDLLPTLRQTTRMDHAAWQTDYHFQRPGVYSFVMEPQPYWEPAEDLYIIHSTKTLVAAYGSEDNWRRPLGLKFEIVPLLRPFGNYAGNTFSGQVFLDGKPVPHVDIEVERYNINPVYTAPTPYHETQVVTADSQGIFSFTCPVGGWWGFAALSEADYTLPGPDGTGNKTVELGAVLWLFLDEWQAKTK